MRTEVERHYPHVRVEGGPRERGRQYGEQARERVLRSREAYEELFAHDGGWNWQRVTQEAMRFRAPIWQFNPSSGEEMRGLAEGSGLLLDDILALNVRTEIMAAARARRAEAQRLAPGAPNGPVNWRPGECTSFATVSERGADGHVIIGQNWDWLPYACETVVVLEARQENKPDYVTVVEAGLLAKTGMNSAGIGLTTNMLATDHDCCKPGVPHHVLLRSILDAETVTEALTLLRVGVRSSSANFLLASADGVALDAEAAPGGLSQLSIVWPSAGTLLHTNHFLSPPPGVTDLYMPNSLVRLQRARGFAELSGGLTVPAAMTMLSDHADYPWGICTHPDVHQLPVDQGATVASVVMDLGARRLWLADGRPCETPYRELDYADFLSKRRTPLPSERRATCDGPTGS